MTDYLDRRLREPVANGKPLTPDRYLYANLDTRQMEKLTISEAVTRRRAGERLEMVERK